MRKFALILCGVLLFCFTNYGFIKWWNSHHGLDHVWDTLTRDWLLLITIADACFFAAFVFIWLIGDMRNRGFSFMKKFLIFLAVLVTGASTFLIYLAFRPEQKQVNN